MFSVYRITWNDLSLRQRLD